MFSTLAPYQITWEVVLTDVQVLSLQFFIQSQVLFTIQEILSAFYVPGTILGSRDIMLKKNSLMELL